MSDQQESNKEEQIHIAADAFIEALQGKEVKDKNGGMITFLKDGVIEIENVLVSDSIEIEGKNTSFNYPIFIRNGEFQDSFVIDGGEFQNFLIDGGEFQTFMIDGGEFQGFSIYGGKFQGFSIFGGEFQGFHIEGGVFQGFGIDGGEFQVFRIKGGEFQGFSIDGGKFNRFWIIEGEFHTFWISEGEFHTFMITRGEFRVFIIAGGKFQGFRIYGGKFQGFSIFGGKYFILMIEGGELQGFQISGGVFQKIILKNNICFIKSLSINVDIESELTIDECKFDSLIFNCTIKNSGKVYIKNTLLNSLTFSSKFTNEGILSVSGINVLDNGDSKLFFTSCDLGNAVFLNVPFYEFNKIVFQRSKINNISTNYGQFPLKTAYPSNVYTDVEEEEQQKVVKHDEREPIDQVQKPKLKYREDYYQLAETYNQLMLAMQKQGNRTWEASYYAEYMEWHRRASLQFWMDTYKSKYLASYVTLTLNKFSTAYGSDWLRGVIWTFILGSVFYTGYTLALPEIHFGVEYLTPENLGFHFGQLLKFIVPTHSIEFIPDTNPGWQSILFDFLGRIAVGYMIYQTIAAFRRFGKH